VSKQLLSEIEEYCKLNNVDVEELVNKMLQQGFTIEKFGSTPDGMEREPIIKEVEKIVEVEVIKEVPVEVIKEITVEKEVYISDDTKIGELLEEIKNLKDGHDLEIDKLNNNVKRQSETVMFLNKTIEEKDNMIKAKDEFINRIQNPPKRNDIYRDGKNGSWGSNLLDE
jgi:hypothetical protein